MRTLALVVALAVATPAFAQVEVQQLAAPDYFSLGSRDTGLPPDLWRGTSPDLARAVLPQIGRKPLSPAAAALARRVLSTGAAGPEGVGRDPEVAAARIQALLALGRPREAWAAVERAPNLPINPVLSEAAAEAALIVGEDDAACRISDALTVGRGELYWLRLRAYCQARAGQTDAAQLTLTLASEKQRDPVVSRLIGAVIAGSGDPGAASLRNGLEYSLSRRLALDLTPALKGASPAVLAAIEPPVVAPVAPGLAGRLTATQGREAELKALVMRAVEFSDPAAVASANAAGRSRAQATVLIAGALGAPFGAMERDSLGGYRIAPGTASPGRLAALDLAAGAGLKGETALHVLAVAAEAGGKPLGAADAARVIAALMRVGLTEDAVRFADEAFVALQAQ